MTPNFNHLTFRPTEFILYRSGAACRGDIMFSKVAVVRVGAACRESYTFSEVAVVKVGAACRESYTFSEVAVDGLFLRTAHIFWRI